MVWGGWVTTSPSRAPNRRQQFELSFDSLFDTTNEIYSRVKTRIGRETKIIFSLLFEQRTRLELVPLFVLVHVHEVVRGTGVLLGLVCHHLRAVLQLVQPLASLNDGHLGFCDLAVRTDSLRLQRRHARAGEVLGHARAGLAGALTEEFLPVQRFGAATEKSL